MQRFLFIIAFFLLSSTGFAQWQRLLMPSTPYNLRFASSDDVIYALDGASFRIHKTKDYQTWEPVATPCTPNNAVQLLTSGDTLIIVEYTNIGSLVHFSFDEGLSWPITNPIPFNIPFNSAKYINGRFIVETGLIEYNYTDNFGATWTARYIGFIPDWKFVEIVNHGDYLYFASKQNDKIYRSVNSGLTWVALPAPPIPMYDKWVHLQSVDGVLYLRLVNSGTGAARWFSSSDNGLVWNELTVNIPVANISSLFKEGTRLYLTPGLVYPLENTYRSSDNGLTWVNMGRNVTQLGKGLLSDRSYFSTDGGDTWKIGGFGLNNLGNSGFNRQYATTYEVVFSDISNQWRINELEPSPSWDLAVKRFGDPVFGTISQDDLVAEYSFGGLTYSTDAGKHWTALPLWVQGKAEIFGDYIFFADGNWLSATNDFGINVIPVQSVPSDVTRLVKSKNKLFAIGNSGVFCADRNSPLDFSLTSIQLPFLPSIICGADTTLIGLFDQTLSVYVNGAWQTADLHLAPNDMPNITEASAAAINGQYFLILNDLGHNPATGLSRRIFQSANKGLDWYEITSQFLPMQNPQFIQSNFALYIHSGNVLYQMRQSVPDVAIVQGQVFFDENMNGLKETTESGLQNQVLKGKNLGVYSTTDSIGFFRMPYSIAKPDTIVPVLRNYHFVTTSEAIVHWPQSANQLIGISMIPNVCDLSIDLENVAPFRPGFTTDLFITVTNVGTKVSEGVVVFGLNPELELLGTIPAAQSQIADTLYFTVPPLQIGESYIIQISVKTEIQVQIGSYLSVAAEVSVGNNDDFDLLNNNATIRKLVVGSFDPNDKSVSSDCLDPHFISDNENLYYTVRFQNTGNFPASFVRIIDTLSQNLQIGSIQVVSASHPYTWIIKGRNVLDVFFDNINLPDSTTNEPASHGYIKFAIKADSTLHVGQSITNAAYIYFDYNPPIVTNEVKSEVKLVRVQELDDRAIDFSISPNPTKTNFTISVEKPMFEHVSVQVFDVNGKLCIFKVYDSLTNPVSISECNVASGVYFVRLKNQGRTMTKKLIFE
jgi:uncharacterized repeat protein (TIGR01451 family)